VQDSAVATNKPDESIAENTKPLLPASRNAIKAMPPKPKLSDRAFLVSRCIFDFFVAGWWVGASW
jgi:hypothetical protein